MATTTKTAKRTPDAPTTARRRTLDSIARSLLNIDTLDPQGRDHLDFHDVHVTLLRRAMEEAWKAGARYHLTRMK